MILNKFEIIALIEKLKLKPNTKINETAIYYTKGNGWNDWSVLNCHELLLLDRDILSNFYLKNRSEVIKKQEELDTTQREYARFRNEKLPIGFQKLLGCKTRGEAIDSLTNKDNNI